MSRWSPADPYISETQKTYKTWTAALHYRQDSGITWYNKVQVYAHSQDQVELLQHDLMSFLNAQELLGVSHG